MTALSPPEYDAFVSALTSSPWNAISQLFDRFVDERKDVASALKQLQNNDGEFGDEKALNAVLGDGSILWSTV